MSADGAQAPGDTSARDVLESHFTLVGEPGALEIIDPPGVTGWTSPDPHPALSLMRWTTQDAALAETALDGVLDRFRAEQRGFDWMTGPDEADLAPLLYERGFLSPALDVAAMARAIPSGYDAPATPDGMRIEKVEDATDMRFSDVMSAGFDVAPEVGAVYHNAYMKASDRQRTELYAAFVDGSRDPAGVGYLSFIGAGPAVLLRVSCVDAAHRGRGIYHALVRHRLAEAARQGRSLAFVHAYSETSGRVLDDLGFANIGTLHLHRWRP